MSVNYRYFTLCSFVFIITVLSTTALFCSNLTSIDEKDTPCFLESSTQNNVLLRTSGNSLILPCHVARSKRAIVEWWFVDRQRLISKIYPVYPPVRPGVLRFVTSVTPHSRNSNETDILDASVLLRHVNVDDTGSYRCVIRPWSTDPSEQLEDVLFTEDIKALTLNYDVQLTAPRLCNQGSGILPCFTAMRTSSPTVIDAYQAAFLQCVVKTQNRAVSVFWVVGDASVNSVLITDYLTTNQHNGDRLRRVFPLSAVDHSIEVVVDRNVRERVYSCVIDGTNDLETTLFTYIVRSIDTHEASGMKLNATRLSEKNHEQDSLHKKEMFALRDDLENDDSIPEKDEEDEEEGAEVEHKEKSEETATA